VGFVIAVDGPAASGKGSLAQALAEHYGLKHLDTGLLYRAVGVRLAADGRDLDDAAAAAAVAGTLTLEELDQPHVRTRAAGEAASRVAAHPSVRAVLLDFQRAFASAEPGAVLDGRDIGTVIAPDAAAKLYVTADPDVRAERRRKQLEGQGESVTFDEVLADINRRDARDGGRDAAPMRPATDAVLLDTSNLTISRAFDEARRIVEAARARWESSRQG
jgi:cytidylate kinase